MGLGNTLKIMLTQQVKCENCGAVIVDGTVGTQSMFKLDAFGNSYKNDNYNTNKLYGDGVGVLNTLKYGSKKKILCSMCQVLEKQSEKMEQIMSQENNEMAGNVTRAANFCTSCGTALKQNAKFCSHCGTKI